LTDERTIDELAAHTRVPSRTIRFYQSKGALPKPVMRGRVAFYGPLHVERLKLIGQLQDRGLRIDAIRELTTRIDKGEVDVGEWLGVDAQLRAPWADDRPRTMTCEELGDRPGVIASLARAKLITRQGDVFVVHSPALVRRALELEAAGVAIDVAVGAIAVLRKHVARASKDVAEFVIDHLDDVDASLDRVRPVALDTVRLLFAREMERVLGELVEQGKTARRRKRR
jgi:DNA-binding transcriptional MerR regulator